MNNQGVSGVPATAGRTQTKRQEQAFFGGAMVIMITGLFIAQTSYIWFMPNQWAFYGLNTAGYVHALVSWNVAFIVGSALAAFAVWKFQKDKIYYLSAILVTIGGILMIPSWDSAAPLILARYIAGIGQGLAFLPTIIHASEVSPSDFRGTTLGSISFYLVCSGVIGFAMIDMLIYIGSMDFFVDQVLGILTLCFGLISIVLNYFRCIESPVYHLQNNDTSSAISCLAKLNVDHPSSPNVASDLVHLQAFVDGQRRFSGSLRPFIRVVALRSVYALSTLTVFNLFTNMFLVGELYQNTLLIAFLVRFFGEAIGIYSVDKAGRRILLLISFGGCVASFVVIGGLFLGDVDYSVIVTGGAFSMVFNFFLGLGLSHISVIYMGESFAVDRKPFYIFVALFLENVIQIVAMVICCYVTIEVAPAYLIVAAVQIVVGGMVCWKTPETKRLTLNESRDILE